MRTLGQRFWAKVEWSDGCWLWQGAKDQNGYGRFWQGPNFIASHRMAYTLAVGPIPDGMQIDHVCRTPRCVNPAHLEPAPPRLNVLRGMGGAGDRAARTHCPKNHPYDAVNTYLAKSNQRHCRECMRARKRLPDTPERRAATHAALSAAGRKGGVLGGIKAGEWARTPEGRAAKSRAGQAAHMPR